MSRTLCGGCLCHFVWQNIVRARYTCVFGKQSTINACSSEPTLDHIICIYKDLSIKELEDILQRRKIEVLGALLKRMGQNSVEVQKTRDNQHTKLFVSWTLLPLLDPLPILDASEGLNLPPFQSVSCWSSSSDPLPDFTFMHLYCYLRARTRVDTESYLLKHTSILQMDSYTMYACIQLLYIKSSCYPSQKVAQSCTVYICIHNTTIQPSVCVAGCVKFICNPMIVIICLVQAGRSMQSCCCIVILCGGLQPQV